MACLHPHQTQHAPSYPGPSANRWPPEPHRENGRPEWRDQQQRERDPGTGRAAAFGVLDDAWQVHVEGGAKGRAMVHDYLASEYGHTSLATDPFNAMGQVLAEETL